MSSDLKTAYSVLQEIGSQNLEQYIEAIKNDALNVQTEIENLRKEIQILVPPLIKRCSELSQKYNESLGNLFQMRAIKDRSNPDRLVAEDQIPRFQEQKLSVVDAQLNLVKLMGVLESQAMEIFVHQELPLSYAFGLGEITPKEQRGYMIRLFRDILGFVPVVDKGASVWSLIDTLKEWTKHKAKLADSINRVRFLVAVAELVRYMRDEGIVKLRELVEDKKEELQYLPGIIAGYEGIYNKLVQETEWLVQELRKPELPQSEHESN